MNECCEADNPESDDSDNDESEDTTNQQETTLVFKWKKKEPEAVDDVSFSGAEFTLPDNVDELSPFSYFKMFW